MNSLNKTKLAIIGLVILGVSWQYLGSPPTELLMTLIVAVSGLGGFELKGQVEEMKTAGTLRVGIPKVEWHKYYWRVLGYFLSFGSLGLIADELIHGPLSFWPPMNHELYGAILGLIGLYLISKKPQGKDSS